MAALFCAVVAARKSRRSLPEFLRILPLVPEFNPFWLSHSLCGTHSNVEEGSGRLGNPYRTLIEPKLHFLLPSGILLPRIPFVTCPVSRLYVQVTADVRRGAARRWGAFRVGEHSGVGSRIGKNWGVRGNLSGIVADRVLSHPGKVGGGRMGMGNLQNSGGKRS